MTIAVDLGRKATKQSNKQNNLNLHGQFFSEIGVVILPWLMYKDVTEKYSSFLASNYGSGETAWVSGL